MSVEEALAKLPPDAHQFSCGPKCGWPEHFQFMFLPHTNIARLQTMEIVPEDEVCLLCCVVLLFSGC